MSQYEPRVLTMVNAYYSMTMSVSPAPGPFNIEGAPHLVTTRTNESWQSQVLVMASPAGNISFYSYFKTGKLF